MFVCFWPDSPQWVMTSSFTRFLEHIQRRTTVGRTLDEWSARRRDLYLTRLTTDKRPCPVGFKPTNSAGERPQTYALDRAATGTGFLKMHLRKKNINKKRVLHSCAFLRFFSSLTYFAKHTKRDVLINARRSSCNKWGHKICPVQLKTETTWNLFYWLLQCGTSWKCTFVGSRAVTAVKKGWKARLTVEDTLIGVY